MFEYRPIEETATDQYIGTFPTYGLELYRDGKLLQVEHDVTTDRCLAEHIAELCTSEQVEPVHIRDVIYNLI